MFGSFYTVAAIWFWHLWGLLGHGYVRDPLLYFSLGRLRECIGVVLFYL